MRAIDLNADIGEGFPYDPNLLQIISSANVCCGEHAGSLGLTMNTIQACEASHVVWGAHPGIADKHTMGRRPIDLDRLDSSSLIESLKRQVGRMPGASYVKLHGALYNQSASDEPIAELVVLALTGFDLPFLGLPVGFHSEIASRLGVRFLSEGFVDRTYTPGGTLTPRSESGAVITEANQAVDQAVSLAKVVDSLCVHGDSPGCVGLALAVKTGLSEAGIGVRSWL